MGNQNSGPRPRPTALKLLAGVTRKDRINQAEPVPPAGDLTKPVGLTAGAEVVWDELVPILTHMGTLTQADARPFWFMCEMQATWVANCQLKGTEGFKPRVELELATALRPYFDYFGMTPSSRARISVKKPKDEPVSKWAGALK